MRGHSGCARALPGSVHVRLDRVRPVGYNGMGTTTTLRERRDSEED
jgi:hypothetical protein